MALIFICWYDFSFKFASKKKKSLYRLHFGLKKVAMDGKGTCSQREVNSWAGGCLPGWLTGLCSERLVGSGQASPRAG